MQSVYGQQGSGPQQGWLQGCEQDFWEGAKGLDSLHPAFSTSSSSPVLDEHLDDFTDIGDILGYDGNLEVFNEVLLSDDHDDFGVALVAQISPLTINVTQHKFPSTLTNNVIQNELPPSSLKIKLKKVKCGKKKPSDYYHVSETRAVHPSISSIQFPTTTYEDLSIFLSPESQTSSSYQDEPNILLSPEESSILLSPENETHAYFDATDSDISSISNTSSSPQSSHLTLVDALNMENADSILDNYINGRDYTPLETISDVTAVTEYTDSDVSTYEDENASTSSASPIHGFSSNTFLPASPYSSDASISSAQQYQLEEGDRSQNKNVKKVRQKMSSEVRYLRKKEQNKQAALRYRAKKKQEDEEMQNRVKLEQEKYNQNLSKLANVKQEINFLKKLMLETCIEKKLVPPNAFD